MGEVKPSSPDCVGKGGLQKPLDCSCKSMTSRGQENVQPQKPFVQRTLLMETDSTGTVAAEGWWHHSRMVREAPVLWCLGKGSRNPHVSPLYTLCSSAPTQMAHPAWDFHCSPCQHSPSCQETIHFFSFLTHELSFFVVYGMGVCPFFTFFTTTAKTPSCKEH